MLEHKHFLLGRFHVDPEIGMAVQNRLANWAGLYT